MMRKFLKFCFVAALAASFTSVGQAAEVKSDITGFGLGYFHNYSYKANKEADGYTKQEFANQGRFGMKITTTEGDVKAGGLIEFDIKDDGSSFEGRDQMAFIEMPSISVGLGRIWFGGITKAGSYYTDKFKVDQFVIGENCGYDNDVSGCRMDSLVVEMKELGLSARWGQDYYEDEDETGKYKEQAFSVIYQKEFGKLDLAAEYNQASTSVDEDLDDGLKDGEYDGAKMSSLAVAAGFKINEKMAVAANIEQSSKTSGASGADTLNRSIVLAAFDMALDDKSGISASYGMQSSDIDDDNEEKINSLVVTYKRKMAGASLYAQYANQSYTSDVDAKNADGTTNDDSTDGRQVSELALGIQYKF